MKLQNYQKNIIVIFIFLILAIAVQIIYYPVGAYDLNADQWIRGGLISAIIDYASFDRDPYLSDMGRCTYNVEMYLHAPFLKIFKNYESYVAFMSFILYFMGMVLFYVLIKILTNDTVISFVASVIFSSSTIWFFPFGDIFALAPIYGACGKSISYIYFLLILIIYQYFRSYKHIDILAIVICMPMLLIHSLTFLGPVTALICFIILKSLYKKEFRKTLGLLLVCFTASIPYIMFFLYGTTAPEPISAADKNLLLSAFKADYPFALGPFSVFQNLRMFLFGTNFFNFFIFLPLYFIFKSSKKQQFYFFLALILILLINTFLFRLIGSFFQHTFDFFIINRNLKWIYFFAVLLFVNLYNEIRENSSFKVRLKLLKPNYIYALIILIAFRAPIKNTFAYSNLATRLVHKLYSFSPQYTSMLLTTFVPSCKDIPKNFGLDVKIINRDAELIAKYILTKIPKDAGLAGPKWINYKIHRSLFYSEPMGFEFYCGMRINKYKKWKAIDENIKLLQNNNIASVLINLKDLGVDYILIEKFTSVQSNKFLKYVPIQDIISHHNNKDKFVEYENDSFLLLRTI